MTSNIDQLLPSAKDVMGKIARAEAEDAKKQAKLRAEADSEKKALIDHLREPSGLSDEEGIRRAMKIVDRATKNRNDRGSGLPLSQPAVHRQGPRYQSAGAWLGKDPRGCAQGNL
jgi:hypothetical protein